jgi:hypothetical protein
MQKAYALTTHQSVDDRLNTTVLFPKMKIQEVAMLLSLLR